MNVLQRPLKLAQVHTLDAFEKELLKNDIRLPVSEDLSVLGNPIELDGKVIPNSMAIHPLEGYDGTADGRPGELIFRRYRRYAEGGAGLLWFEACAVAGDGRCNPYQMWIRPETLPEIKRLVEETNRAAMEKFGRKPYNVLQLTHSGRCSRDENWNPIPLAAFENPYIDKYYKNLTIATDERIERLEDEMVNAAVLAHQAGFDAVDIKICHNYIMRELLAAYTRPGKYGGSFENRTRFLFNVIDRIRERLSDKLQICVRINAYDCIPYPYGWGMKQEAGVYEPDITEPVKLLRMLCRRGVRLFNVSTMMPRYSPLDSGYVDSHSGNAVLNPYKSTQVLLDTTRKLKEAVPEGIFVATGLTWFEQFGANVGAGGIREKWFDIAGFGRQAFAYPDFAEDILKKGKMERNKCCVTCDKCYELMSFYTTSGCVMRDQEVYLTRYREEKRKREEKQKLKERQKQEERQTPEEKQRETEELKSCEK